MRLMDVVCLLLLAILIIGGIESSTRFMRKLICALFGHDWSPWGKARVLDIRYRVCRRCGALETEH